MYTRGASSFSETVNHVNAKLVGIAFKICTFLIVLKILHGRNHANNLHVHVQGRYRVFIVTFKRVSWICIYMQQITSARSETNSIPCVLKSNNICPTHSNISLYQTMFLHFMFPPHDKMLYSSSVMAKRLARQTPTTRSWPWLHGKPSGSLKRSSVGYGWWQWCLGPLSRKWVTGDRQKWQ